MVQWVICSSRTWAGGHLKESEARRSEDRVSGNARSCALLLEPGDCSFGPCWKVTSRRTVSGFGHEPLDFQSYIFEALFNRPAFFSKLDLMLGHSYQHMNLKVLPLLPFRECPDGGSGLADLRVDVAK